MGFQQGLSGLDAASQLLSNIGNNLSNANTVGFKSSETQFSDLFASSLSGANSAQNGIGTQVSAVVQQFSQGNIVSTSNPLDMAINGLGFFRMEDKSGSISYSRNGQFQINSSGVIVNAAGQQLTGYPINASGIVSGAKPVPLTIPTTSLAPSASTKITAGLNLPSSDTPIVSTSTFDPTNVATYNESTSVNFYDSLGNSHVMTLYFVNNQNTTTGGTTTPSTQLLAAQTAVSAYNGTTPPPSTKLGTPTQAWSIYATLDGSPISPATTTGGTTTPASYNLGNLAFDGQGNLVYSQPVATTTTPSGTPAASVQPIGTVFTPSLTFSNGANTQQMSMDFSSTAQFGTAFTVNNLAADGYTSGQLTGFNTSAKGILQGQYSNGQTKDLGQLVLANFSDPQGLQVASGGSWIQTTASGAPLLGTPGTGNLGTVQSSATESSNVDMTTELVNMLTAQRYYQANAQAIQTQNQAEQTIINLR